MFVLVPEEYMRMQSTDKQGTSSRPIFAQESGRIKDTVLTEKNGHLNIQIQESGANKKESKFLEKDIVVVNGITKTHKVIRRMVITTSEDEMIWLEALLTRIESRGSSLKSCQIFYYSEKEGRYIFCGVYPNLKVKEISAEVFEDTPRITLKVNEPVFIYGMSKISIDEVTKDFEKQKTQINEAPEKEVKSKCIAPTVHSMITDVLKWKLCTTGVLKCKGTDQEASQFLNVPLERLQYFEKMLDCGFRFGFDFYENLDSPISALEWFLKFSLMLGKESQYTGTKE